MEGIVTLAILIVLVLLCGFAYKKRHSITKWLNEPYYPNAYVVDRKLVLKRRIEDAQLELDYMEQKEKEVTK